MAESDQNSDDKSGIELRKQNRRQELAKQQQKAIKTAEKITEQMIDLGKVANADDPQAIFDKQWKGFDKALKADNSCKTARNYAHAYNAAVKIIQQKIEELELPISFPRYIVIGKRAEHFRTQEWFLNGKVWYQVYQDWLTGFNQPKPIDLKDVLLSLILQNGIVEKAVLQHIINQLIKRQLVIHELHKLPFILLESEKIDGFATNVQVGDIKQTQLLKFLSPITARLITLLDIDAGHSQDFDILLRGVLLDNRYTFEQISQQKKLNAALYVLEHVKGFDVSEMMLAIMQGRPKSYSLPLANWQVISQNRCNTQIHIKKLAPALPQYESKPTKNQNKLLSIKIKKLFDSLDNQKLGKTQLAKNFELLIAELQQINAPTNELALVQWLASKQKTCKPSSIHTYSNRLSNRWLALTDELDLDSFDEEDYEALYEELLNLAKNESAKQDLATLIDDFHSFLVINFDAVSIAPLSTGSKQHHKTAYVSETMFQTVLAACDMLDLTEHDKNNLKITLIMAHRLGMRIGEITKLRLKEISPMLEYCEIRDNQLANNKSTSALRRLLIQLMLLQSEFDLLRQVYESRKLSKHTTLIATESGHPLLKSSFSQQITMLLQQVTGLYNLSTHSLRHSGISNLQLMRFLTDDDYTHLAHPAIDALQALMPYDKETAKNIITTIFSKLAYQDNYAIAGFAGHAHPNVSFESYIHFTDIMLGILLWHCDYQLTTEQAKNMLAIPRRNLNIIDHRERFNDYIFNKIKCQPLPALKTKTINKASKPKKQKFTFDTVKALLSSFGTEEFEIQRNYFNVPVETFNQWLGNANKLKTETRFFTKNHKSRLFIDDNLWVNNKKLTEFEGKINAKLITNFRKHFNNPKHQENLAFFVMYILTNSLVSDATLNFDNVHDLQKFMKAVNCLEMNENTYLSVHHLTAQPKVLQKQWQTTWKKLAKNHVSYHDTEQRKRQPIVKLAIMENKDANKRQILSYFASFVFIMMRETIEKYV